jgi:hypothetical protein
MLLIAGYLSSHLVNVFKAEYDYVSALSRIIEKYAHSLGRTAGFNNCYNDVSRCRFYGVFNIG